jgi:hypothetical protein
MPAEALGCSSISKLWDYMAILLSPGIIINRISSFLFSHTAISALVLPLQKYLLPSLATGDSVTLCPLKLPCKMFGLLLASLWVRTQESTLNSTRACVSVIQIWADYEK